MREPVSALTGVAALTEDAQEPGLRSAEAADMAPPVPPPPPAPPSEAATAPPAWSTASLAGLPRVVPPHRAPPERELPIPAYLRSIRDNSLRGFPKRAFEEPVTSDSGYVGPSAQALAAYAKVGRTLGVI